MKKATLYLSFVIFTLLVAVSCSKETITTPAVSGNSDQSLTAARATVTKFFAQEELYYNDCCGEDIQLIYNVLLVELPDGTYRASLNNLSGFGVSSGTQIHGANTQGVIFNGNNVTQTFSTVLTMGGCVSIAKIVFHVTVDSQGNPIIIKDSFKVTCNGN